MEKSMHGGDLYRTSQIYGFKENEILDFSSNINALGLSEQLKELLHARIDGLVNYPDPECNELREELSQYLGVPKSNIITGNGASEMIYLLLDVLKPNKILIPAPCFSEYSRAALIAACDVEYHELKEENGFRLNMNEFIKHMNDFTGADDAVLLCNPNNPTSAMISKSELLDLVESAQEKEIKIIIDEAFIELTVGGNKNSMVEYLNQFNNLYIFRALTKILAVPGLRLGYALCSRDVINEMWKKKIPWSVNSLSCSIGKVLNNDVQYFAATEAWLSEEKEWLFRELSGIGKLKVFKPDTNFILLKLLGKESTSDILKHRLIAEGILIRDASNFIYLNEKFIRVAVKDRESNEKLIRALTMAL